jgi:hypothetical protein
VPSEVVFSEVPSDEEPPCEDETGALELLELETVVPPQAARAKVVAARTKSPNFLLVILVSSFQ